MLEVRLHGRRVGVLRRKPNGNLQFRYDTDYVSDEAAVPLSHGLPLQNEGFPHRACLAFFGGLLPEQDVRSQVALMVGVSAGNDYALLERLAGDCAGAVTLVPEGAGAPMGNQQGPGSDDELEKLDADSLAELLADLPERPLAVDDRGEIRLSLAGAQSKLPVIDAGGAFALPKTSNAPTTHILKPEPERFPGLVANEFFCMRLAAAVGLPVSEVAMAATSLGLPYLTVTRYDRDLTHEPIRRLHQEDLCQALGRLPTEKYQQEGGPSVKDAMVLLNRSAVPAQDRPQLWSALIFNALIGNCDAHGKNFSLLYDSAAPHLAPLYDLVSTAVYEKLTTRLAMSLDGARRLEDVEKACWRNLAEEIGLSPLYATRRVSVLAGETVSAARELGARPEHRHAIVDEIRKGIEERADRLQ